MTELPLLIGGKYRPIRVIGQGGMGLVYEVVHENTGERLALKVLLARSRLAPELVERFRREARATASVKSDHVVRVTDADIAAELGDAPFLVMELLEGQNFEELCLERRPSAVETVDWLRQVARALDRAHRQRIVHRDLKPENLFLAKRADFDPIVKVLDFGIAKMLGEAGAETASGQILGTPRYMAPEQADRDATGVSAASDRYALGLIAFRLLSGRHYFQESQLMKLLQDVAAGPLSAPSSLGCAEGPLFDAWFARACALDPAQRFESCFEQIEALARALGLASIATPSAIPSAESPPGNAVPSKTAELFTEGTPPEVAPTLVASVVSAHPKTIARPNRTWIWAAGGLGTAAIGAFLILRHPEPMTESAIQTVSADAATRSPPAATSSAERFAAPPAVIAVPVSASTTTSAPSASVSLPARRPSAAAASSSDSPARGKPRPKDHIWDEP